MKNYISTFLFEDPDTEAINHLLIFLSEFKKNPNTKTKCGKNNFFYYYLKIYSTSLVNNEMSNTKI